MRNNVDLKVRPVVKVIRGQAASDGAGVKLTRVIGTHALPELDQSCCSTNSARTTRTTMPRDFPIIRIAGSKR